MSLHALANQIQGAGRGPDTTLVHMTPGEVNGLQSLAMAHGGSLSINPETGLPEAGFLSSILPMVAGVALNALAPGAGAAVGGAFGLGGAAGTGLLVGGATALATGSLQKGLMAGLGAYGGAGLGGSFGIGGAANAANAGVSAAQAAANSQIGQTMAGTGSSALSPAAGTPFTLPNAGLPTAPTIPTAPAAQVPVSIQQTNQDIIKTLQAQQPNYAQQAPVQDVAAANMENARQVQQAQMQQQAQIQQQAEAARQAATRAPSVSEATSAAAAPAQSNQPSFMNKLGSLFSSDKKEGEKSAAGSFLDDNKYYLGAMGASMLLSPEEKKKKAAQQQAAMGYDPRYQAYRTPVTTAPNGPNAELRYFADGGIASLQNPTAPIGDNQNYPMAKQFSSVYAQPGLQDPQSAMPGDGDVNPYTGETRFAKGGKTTSAASSSGGGLGSIVNQRAAEEAAKKKEEAEGFMPKYESYNSKTGQYVETGTREREEAERKQREEYKPATKADFSDFAKEYGGDYNKKQRVTADMMNKAYQRAHGRDATPEEIKAVSKSTMSMARIMDNLSKHSGAIDRYNEQAKGDFDQKLGETKAVQAEANRASKGDVAASYYQMFGKPPDENMLNKLYDMKKTPQEIRGEMMKTDEYQKMLTTPAAPKMTTDASGRVSVEGALSPYKSPTEQLGLTDYYKNWNAQMANQPQVDRRSVAAPAQTQQFARVASVPVAGYNNNIPTAPPPGMMPQQGFVARPGAPAPGMGQQMGGGVYSGGIYQARYAGGGDVFAGGGISNLGGYSDGGRLLKGPGDGVSDSIPAQIGSKQPARLADGEFVVPARIVSELGNGSTEAGARELYKMMDRVQKGRRKTVGKGKVATDAKARKQLPV